MIVCRSTAPRRGKLTRSHASVRGGRVVYRKKSRGGSNKKKGAAPPRGSLLRRESRLPLIWGASVCGEKCALCSAVMWAPNLVGGFLQRAPKRGQPELPYCFPLRGSPRFSGIRHARKGPKGIDSNEFGWKKVPQGMVNAGAQELAREGPQNWGKEIPPWKEPPKVWNPRNLRISFPFWKPSYTDTQPVVELSRMESW